MQLILAVGNVEDQLAVLEAKENILTTWNDLMDKAKIPDRNAPLKDGRSKPLGLEEPTNPVVALCVYVY